MLYRKLTSDGDYSFGQSQDDFFKNVPEAVGQAIQTRLWLWEGEWFLDITEGTPYMLGVFGKNKKEEADLTITQRTLGTQGLVDIEDYESTLDPENRLFSVTTLRVNTLYGTTAIQVENYNNF